MGGQDKGLLRTDGRPLIELVIDALAPQVDSLLISANRNLDAYRALGHPILRDAVGDYWGPLVGIASAMQHLDAPYLLVAPCDSPRLPADLRARLHCALEAERADMSAAHDGRRMQPLFALLRRELLADLLGYLDSGGRKVHDWYARHRLALADFSDQPNAFINANTPADLQALRSARDSIGSSD